MIKMWSMVGFVILDTGSKGELKDDLRNRRRQPFLVFANKVHPSVTMSTTTTTMLVH